MIVNKKSFQRKSLSGKTAEVLTVKLNREENQTLKSCALLLQQPKRSTALKQIASIGAKVLLDDKIGVILQVILENKRKNKRMGIIDIESELDAKVSQMD